MGQEATDTSCDVGWFQLDARNKGFYHEGSQTGTQESCGIAVARDTQNLIGQCPRH